MKRAYPVIFHEEDGYWAEFPDLEGCSAQGDDYREALEEARKSMGLYLAAMLDGGKMLPEPTPLSDIGKVDDGFAVLVEADPDEYRRDTSAVSRTVTLPAWLAKEAEAADISLSKVIQDALVQRLADIQHAENDIFSV